jgi:hypothetical protein
MRQPAMLFEPIVNIRDLLESFLVDRVVLGDWRGTLTSWQVPDCRSTWSWSQVVIDTDFS